MNFINKITRTNPFKDKPVTYFFDINVSDPFQNPSSVLILEGTN